MDENLNKTFDYLAKTENESAVEVLVSELGNPYAPTREGALSALLNRQSAAGFNEIFRRFPNMDESMRSVVKQCPPQQLNYAIGEVLSGSDAEAKRTVCEVATEYHLYGAITTLSSALMNPANTDQERIAQTVLQLTDLFYKELSDAGEAGNAQDFDRLRDEFTKCLEESVRKYYRHKQRDVVEAFLLLARTKNSALNHVLTHPEDSAFDPMIESLTQSPRGGVKRLLLAFLAKSQIPAEVKQVFADRCDPDFVTRFLHLVVQKRSKTFTDTLGQFKQFAWAEPGHEIFEKLDETAQAGAVALLTASGLNKSKIGKLVEYLLVHGNPGGRLAAAEALSLFPSEETDALIVSGLDDEDPAVLAALLLQLRAREIPGALGMLFGMVDHPDPRVKAALLKALPEFSLHRFLQQVKDLSDTVAATTAQIVRKLNPDCLPMLSEELMSRSPLRRRYAIIAADAMGLAPELTRQLNHMLTDTDLMVRKTAEEVLARCHAVPCNTNE
jgi:hypothetical protein